MLEFSQFEAGYIISQAELETALGSRYADNPDHFEKYRADVYRVVQQALDRITPHQKLVVYPALDSQGFVVLDPQHLTAADRQLYHQERDRLLSIQAKQDMKRSEL